MCPLSWDTLTLPGRRPRGGLIFSKPSPADRPRYHSRFFSCLARILGANTLGFSRHWTSEERLAATKYDRIEVESILINKTTVGEAPC
jgi:hypothetical protein